MQRFRRQWKTQNSPTGRDLRHKASFRGIQDKHFSKVNFPLNNPLIAPGYRTKAPASLFCVHFKTLAVSLLSCLWTNQREHSAAVCRLLTQGFEDWSSNISCLFLVFFSCRTDRTAGGNVEDVTVFGNTEGVNK